MALSHYFRNGNDSAFQPDVPRPVPDRFPAFFGDDFFLARPQHHGAVFLDAVVVVAVLAQRNQVARYAGVPGAAVDHVADGEEEFLEDERDVDEQLLFDLYQQVFVGQFERYRYRLVGFPKLFNDFFHGARPLCPVLL
ncbi:hypothetical protein L1887_51795 [Cichorium endivia]|nr:hypothetical protein L1887_51795 [Cichorium endivia]